MTTAQKIIKYFAIAFAVLLIAGILNGIIGAADFFTGLYKNDVSEEAQSYTLSQNIKSIEIDINAASLDIKTADSFYLESNLKKLSVKEKDGRLHIKETGSIGFSNNGNRKVTLCVPENYEFESVNINTGAGKLSVNGITAVTADIDLGAGKTEISNLTVTNEAEIDGGAGAVDMKDCVLNDLDLDIGVGKVSFSGTITGNSKLDCGVGEISAQINGSADDYRISVDKGIGDITVDGRSASDGQVIGNGKNRIKISGGVGNVKVEFSP